MPVARERRREHGKAPVFSFLERACRPDEPARFGGAGMGFGRKTQKKCADTFPRRGQREAAAGNEIESFRHARNFDHHGAQHDAGKRIVRGAQGTRRIADPQEQNPRGVESQLEKTRGGKLAELESGEIPAYPKKRFALGRPHGRCRRKTARRRFASCFRRKDFMQSAAEKPALQTRIGGGMAERHAGIKRSRGANGISIRYTGFETKRAIHEQTRYPTFLFAKRAAQFGAANCVGHADCQIVQVRTKRERKQAP